MGFSVRREEMKICVVRTLEQFSECTMKANACLVIVKPVIVLMVF